MKNITLILALLFLTSCSTNGIKKHKSKTYHKNHSNDKKGKKKEYKTLKQFKR